jgi:hypothetical protein
LPQAVNSKLRPYFPGAAEPIHATSALNVIVSLLKAALRVQIITDKRNKSGVIHRSMASRTAAIGT